jgi:hypothetical protein
MSTTSWQCQGRQSHGWFGSDTCPHPDDSSKAPCANCLNASVDRAIEASIKFLPAAAAAMYRQWLAQKQGRQIMHQAVQKMAALEGVSKDRFKRLADWAHDEGQDARAMVRKVVADAKKPVAEAAE